ANCAPVWLESTSIMSMVRIRIDAPARMTTGGRDGGACADCAGAGGGGGGCGGAEKRTETTSVIGTFMVGPEAGRNSTWRAVPPTKVPSTLLPFRRLIVSASRETTPARGAMIRDNKARVIGLSYRRRR